MSKEALKLALEALEWITQQRTGGMIQRKATEAITAIKQARSAPAAKGWKLVPVNPTPEQIKEGNKVTWPLPCAQVYASMLAAAPEAPPAQPAPVQPVAIRMPTVGDRVVCIEDESLGTVVYLTAGGSPEIKFDDGSHGTYMLREFAELFGYTTPPAQEFVCSTGLCHYKPAAPVQSLPFGVGGGLVAIKTLLSRDPCVHANTAIEMLDAILKEHPAAQRQWVGLTNEEKQELVSDEIGRVRDYEDYADAIEAKLKELNT